MGEVSQISEFGKIFIFLITGFVLVAVVLIMGKIVAPSNPTPEKLTSYECGEEPTGSAWLPFNPRFYVIALVFLLFDVEMVFVIPWATVFGNHQLQAADSRWSTFTLIEMFVFLGILILGLAYVWRKGDLDWIKPNPVVPQTNVNIPASLYENLNQRQSAYQVRAFNAELAKVEPVVAASSVEATPIKKPQFKPSFKKSGDES